MCERQRKAAARARYGNQNAAGAPPLRRLFLSFRPRYGLSAGVAPLTPFLFSRVAMLRAGGRLAMLVRSCIQFAAEPRC